jgi:hypothetical protein
MTLSIFLPLPTLCTPQFCLFLPISHFLHYRLLNRDKNHGFSVLSEGWEMQYKDNILAILAPLNR